MLHLSLHAFRLHIFFTLLRNPRLDLLFYFSGDGRLETFYCYQPDLGNKIEGLCFYDGHC